MSNDLNQCNFIGRLGRDPETKYTASGSAVCNFSIACGWKGKNSEGVEWIPVTTFDKLAEICGQYLKTGSQVFISGRFKTDKYTDKDGNDRYSTKIVADTMQMLGSKSDNQASGDDYAKAKGGARKPAPKSDMSNLDDSIPF